VIIKFSALAGDAKRERIIAGINIHALFLNLNFLT
jgi:hypothetical protein